MKTTLYFTLTLLTFLTLTFVSNSFAQDDSAEYVVRVVYFLPNDRQQDPDINTKLDILIKDIQQYYANMMEFHGFDRKTFRIETDGAENVIVHHVNGKFNDAYYQTSGGSWRVFDQVEEQFDTSNNIYLIVLDISSSYLEGTGSESGGLAGLGSGNSLSGSALVTASDTIVAFHELGHTFGLRHNSFLDAKPYYPYPGTDTMTRSFCAAEWLDVHRYFNTSQNAFNENTNVQMLTLTLASPPYNIRLRFEVNDSDGLQQAQLYKPYGDYPSVIACQELNGNKTTVEFITDNIIGGNTILLRVMDVNGNFTSHRFPIDTTALLPPPEVVSIPDTNLAAAVRETLGLASQDPITQLDMVRLTNFSHGNRQITELTGLQHATNIYWLVLWGNQISDITVLAGLTDLVALFLDSNQISDITPLANLTNLFTLLVEGNSISDITPLANLTRLEALNLRGNQISDVSPLAELTNLRILHLTGNKISDVSPLAELVNLKELHLEGNPIKDREPLLALLQKNPDVKIYLEWGSEPLPVTLSHFRAEHTDAGVVIKWTTESEVDNAGFYILRSETKDGAFKVVNPSMVQGAGTTGERSNYTWIDTTAKPNTVYYYQIEDVSYAGVRKQLATVRLKGLVSASGKLATRWADLKTQN